MSNVDFAREAWGAYIGSGLDIAASAPYFAEDCEYEDPPEAPDARTWRGPLALERYVANFESIWDDYSLELLEVEDHGEAVVCKVAVRGFARGTSSSLDVPLYFVSRVRDRKIVHHACFFSRESALEAAAQSRGEAARS